MIYLNMNALGGSRASTLDGTCVWKIVGFSGCRRKPTSPCPFSSERPVLGSSQRDGTSAADAMVEKIQFQKILKNLRLFVKNHSCIATSRPLPGSQQLPLVLQTTPLAPQVPPGSTPIDGGGILLFLDFRHSAHSHPTPDHPAHFTYARPPTRLRKPASAPFFPFSEANSSVLVRFENRPRGEGGSGGGTCPPRYWPATRPGLRRRGPQIQNNAHQRN